MWCIAIWYHLYNLKKREKQPWRSVTFSLGFQSTTLLKVTLPRFLNCTEGTKSRKTAHINCSNKRHCFRKHYSQMITQALEMLLLIIFDNSYFETFNQPKKTSLYFFVLPSVTRLNAQYRYEFYVFAEINKIIIVQYSTLLCVNVGILDRAHGKTGESANSANSQPPRPSSQHGSVVSPEPSTPSTNATGMRTKIHVCFYFEIPFY